VLGALGRTGTAAAGDLTGRRARRNPDANAESLGILVFAGVRLVAVARVQEETSTPHSRLACIHLQNLLIERHIGARKTE
jgi:hypothetical protein